MPDSPPSAQRQFLIRVAGIPGYFATKAGGKTSAAVAKVWDGGSLDPENLAGPAETENLTLGRPYRVSRDQPMIDTYEPLVGRFLTTVSIAPTDRNLVPLTKPRVYVDSLLVGVTPPDGDAASSDPATVEVEFAVKLPA